VRNKRYTLAVRQLVADETSGDVLNKFLELLDCLDLGVKAVYLDRGFYNSTCLGLLYAYNYAYVIPVVRWGETIQNELSSGWSRVIEHEPAGKVTFPVYIDCVYLQGRYDEHGWRVTATALTRRSLRLHTMLENITASGSASNRPSGWLGRSSLLRVLVTPDYACCCLS